MDTNWEEKLAKELPKVELHLHLDGSISPGQFKQISGKTYKNLDIIWNISKKFQQKFCYHFESEFIARRAKERNITLPVPDPVNQLEKWLHNQKKSASQKDPANG